MAHTYKDAVVFKKRIENENKALVKMVDRSSLSGNIIIIADRGYEAYNNMAHIQEKGWKYLIRIKDFQNYSSGILHGLELPDEDEFDEYMDLKLTRKQTNEVKELLKDKNHYRRIAHGKPFDYLPETSKKADETVFYELPFRVVRFPITDDTYEVVVTNLDKEDFARLTMYNFSELITSHVILEKRNRKHTYKVNFSVATHICREFLLGKCIPSNIEAIIARYITPIRSGRSRPRDIRIKQAISFMYRVA